jgi:lactate dehydrogenase-like 2-hydroxyacid dehydrogenase
VLRDRADIAVFQNHLADPDAVIERLPNLKLIASTGTANPSIDVAAAGDRGIAVVHTGYRSDPTIEFTWALILRTP